MRATGAVRAKVVDTTPVEGAVDLVVADEAVWVSGFGVLSRLDAATGRVVATVDVKGVEDFSRVAVGMGSVWVTADGGLLYRIDADTNRVLATIAVGGVISGVETGGGSVWVARTERGEIVCVDPPTDRVVGQPIRVGPGPGDVLYAYGALWVANTSPASLVRVDASSGAVTPQSWASDLAGRLAAGFGSIWEASGGDSVIRADPVTGRVLALIPVPRGSSVAIGASRVWVLGRPDANAEPSSQAEGAALWQIDPTRNDVVGSSTPVGARGSIALAARDGAVWIADYEGQTVTKLDVVPCSKSCEARDRISRVELPDGLSAERLAVGEGAVWAVASTANGSRSALVRIDPSPARSSRRRHFQAIRRSSPQAGERSGSGTPGRRGSGWRRSRSW